MTSCTSLAATASEPEYYFTDNDYSSESFNFSSKFKVLSRLRTLALHAIVGVFKLRSMRRAATGRAVPVTINSGSESELSESQAASGDSAESESVQVAASYHTASGSQCLLEL